jgi:hypothetical protein
MVTVEAVEAAEQVSEGDDEGTDRCLGRKRSRGDELLALEPSKPAQSSWLQAQEE